MSESKALPQSLVETVAGLLAGIASTLVAHPLDLIKTRLQVDRTSTTQLGSSLRITRHITRNEGLRGFYRGLTPNLVGNPVSWALYFLWYGNIKDGLQYAHTPNTTLSSYDYFLASGTAGALTAVCTNPIWVIKTRMLSTSSSRPGAYSSLLDGTRQIYKFDGIRGFYRGLLPSLFGVSHGALQFMAYEQLKIYRASTKLEGQQILNSVDVLMLSGLAKVFAGTATYPYQVVRARLQMYDADRIYEGARDLIAQIWRREGFKGFYKGLGPNLLRVLPNTWVTFLVYEKTKIALSEGWEATL